MAEQNQEIKTIKFAGRDLDLNEFVRRALAKAVLWMDYQGLKGDERTDFLNSFNERLRGITDGSYSVTDSGEIAGAPASKEQYYGKHSGERKEDGQKKGGWFRTVRRTGFDPNGNVDIFLNGIAGAMPEHKVTNAAAAKDKKLRAWNSATSMGQYLSDLIFGEGNPFNANQLQSWADALDPYTEGTPRSIQGRTSFINQQLANYRQDLLDGRYDLSDEERDGEILKIDRLVAGGLQNWEIGKLAPWMSNLLYTDDKYYETPEAREAALKEKKDKADAEARLKAALDYLNGVDGATNPYEQGTDAYNALELSVANKRDLDFDKSFTSNTWSYSPTNSVFTSTVAPGLQRSVFEKITGEDLLSYLNGAEGLTVDNDGRDILLSNWRSTVPFMGELGHDDYAGWKSDGSSDISLAPDASSPLRAYFDALRPVDEMPDDTFMTTGRNNGRSNAAILGKVALDYARAATAHNDDNRLRDGSYLLPEFIDWNTGKAYTFTFENDGHGSMKPVNIGSIINGMDKNSPLYKRLLNDWRAHKGKSRYSDEALNAMRFANGGIIKAADGIKLSEDEIKFLTGLGNPTPEFTNPKYATNNAPLDKNRFFNASKGQEELDQEYDRAQAVGVAKDADRKTEFTATDWARLGTAAADLTGAILSFTGVGSTAGAAIGAGSTLTLFGLDMADGSVGMGEALIGLGTGLALDALTLIPGDGAAGIAKAARTVAKLAGPLMMSFQLMGNAEGAMATLTKIKDGKTKDITVGEWRQFTKALNAVTNTTTMGKTAFDRNIGKFAKYNKGEKQFKLGYTDAEGKVQQISLTETLIRDINTAGKAGGNEAALAKLNAYAGTEGLPVTFTAELMLGMGANFANYQSKNPFSRISNLKGEFAGRDNSAALLEGDKANIADRAKMGRFRKFFADRFGTDYENATGGRGAFNARVQQRAEAAKAERAARRQALKEELDAARNVDAAARTAALNTEGRTFQSDAELNDAISRMRALNQAKREAQAALGVGSRAEIGTKGTPGYVGAQEATGATAKFEEANAAFKAAQAKPYNPAERGHLNTYKEAIGKRQQQLQADIDNMGEAAPVRSEYTARTRAANKEAKRLTAEIDAKQLALDAYINSHPSPTKSMKASIRKQLKAIDALVKTRDEQLALAKQQSKDFKAALKAWDLGEKAKALSEIGAKKIADIDTRLGEITELENAYNSARGNFQKARDEFNRANAALDKAIKDSNNGSLQNRIAALKAKNRTKLASVSDKKYEDIMAHTLEKGIEGGSKNIKDAKRANFQQFLKDLNDRKDMNESKILELLQDKEFMTAARQAYHFRLGGIISPLLGANTNFYAKGGAVIKANLGLKTEKPEVAPAAGTTAVTADASGSTAGTTVKPGNATGTVSFGGPKPAPSTYKPVVDYTALAARLGRSDLLGKITGKVNDFMPTILAETGYRLNLGISDKILNKAKSLQPVYKTFVPEHYRLWSTKPMIDLAQLTITDADNMGAVAARSQNNVENAFAMQHASHFGGVKSAQPMYMKADENLQESVNTQNKVANANNQGEHLVAEGNHTATKAKENQDIMAEIQWLHDRGTKQQQHNLAIQKGWAVGQQAQYKAEYDKFLATDPTINLAKAAYEALYNEYLTNPDAWTEEKNQALRNARIRYVNALTTGVRNWTAAHPLPISTPYAGMFGRSYQITNTAPFSFGDDATSGFSFSAKQGGKMELAEKEKTRRKYADYYHDSLKTLVKESNKKQLAMKSGYGYFHKLMMQSK